MIQTHTIKAARGSRHRRKIIGRGNASGHGTYSTRGGKGQTARSGGRRGLWLKAFKPLLQSTPKLRGFKSMHKKPSEITLTALEKNFPAGATVDRAALVEKRLISKEAGAVKILATGALTKALTVVGLPGSAGATEKIKAAGGAVSP